METMVQPETGWLCCFLTSTLADSRLNCLYSEHILLSPMTSPKRSNTIHQIKYNAISVQLLICFIENIVLTNLIILTIYMQKRSEVPKINCHNLC